MARAIGDHSAAKLPPPCSETPTYIPGRRRIVSTASRRLMQWSLHQVRRRHHRTTSLHAQRTIRVLPAAAARAEGPCRVPALFERRQARARLEDLHHAVDLRCALVLELDRLVLARRREIEADLEPHRRRLRETGAQ